MSAYINAVLLCFAVGILFIVNAVSQTVPELNFFQLTPQENGYTLRITLPNGSQRKESMELKNSGTPQQYISVVGKSSTIYPRSTATVTYIADKNGYLVRYIFNTYAYIPAFPKAERPRLNPKTLMASVG